ncbi:hypothetical protein, partial [Salmonella enterica]|uniref:hypothetical protein n=1 Tax=Salmonella enterica TaxID=28901 RepID=UPI0020C2364C
PFANETVAPDVAESSTSHLNPPNLHNVYQHQPSTHRWTKDHPLENIIGNPNQPVVTRQRLHTDGEHCIYALTVCQSEPKNNKDVMTKDNWIESMQEELNQFKRLEVWELVE